MKIINKKWFIKIIFSKQEKKEIENNTCKWNYYKDLENFYYLFTFTDLLHKNIEIDFATRYKLWKTVNLFENYDIDKLLLDIEKKLKTKKEIWDFEDKLVSEEIIEYYFDFENSKLKNEVRKFFWIFEAKKI